MNRLKFIKTLSLAPIFMHINSLQKLEKKASEWANTERMPVLFLGHGSPMNAIEDNEFTRAFREVASCIEKPKAIICVSAHWYTKGTKVTAMSMPRTIHDFGGFPQVLFDQQYPAPGQPVLAQETADLLSPVAVELDEKWGLDHGAWSVLTHLYPDANIPVIQLSIDYTKDASYHYDLAQRLSSLRDKGVLIVGSGNIIHNLSLVDFRNLHKDNYGFDWAIEAHETINNHLLMQDYKSLMTYANLGKAVQLAVPTPDHYLPMIYSLGLIGKHDSVELFNDKLLGGSLSMTSIKIGF